MSTRPNPLAVIGAVVLAVYVYGWTHARRAVR